MLEQSCLVFQKKKAQYSEDKLYPNPDVCEMEEVLNGKGRLILRPNLLFWNGEKEKDVSSSDRKYRNMLPKRRGAEVEIPCRSWKEKRWET